MSASADPWDSIELSPEEAIDVYKSKSESESGVDAWDQVEFQESFWKNAFRTALQVPQGLAEVTPSGIAAGLWQLLGQGAVLDPEEIEHIKDISEREGIPFDEEAYMEAAQNALKYIPTVSNIARGIEEETGIPLEAKTGLQKGVRLGASAGKIQPGTVGQKATSAVVAPTTSALLQEAGLPEVLADVVGLGTGTVAGAKAPKVDVSTAKKPSGLKTRQFEKLERPVEVSGKKIKQINEKLEGEFRDIASDIIEKSPLKETYTELKNDAGFKLAAEEAFEKVDKIAQDMPEKVSIKDLKKDLADIASKKESGSITPLEFDKEYKKFINEFIKDTKAADSSLSSIVNQYRKNNKAYGKSWESAKSTDYNVAKREALLDYNKVIADTIEKKFPDSEFSNLFKSSNEKWKKIMDAEAVDAYMNDVFDGKINYKKSGELFNKKQNQIFRRSLGKEGYKDFEQLTKDLMSTEKAHKMMKVAEDKGYKDLARTGLSYVIHPKIGVVKMGLDMAKESYRFLWEATLDKPQLMVTWDKGVKAFKKGDFSQAETQFNKLKSEVDAREKALKDFKAKQKQS